MKEKTDKILTLALLGLAIVISAFAFIFALNATPENGVFDIAFWLLVVMVVFSIGAILYFLFKAIIQKGLLVKFLIGLVAIAALLTILYLIANGNDIDLIKYDITKSLSKWIGAACILCYLLCGVAALSILVMSIMPKKISKK